MQGAGGARLDEGLVLSGRDDVVERKVDLICVALCHRDTNLISQKVLVKSFGKSQLPQNPVNLS